MSLITLESTLKALADKNRLRIVALLARRPMCVCELADIIGITQPSVSKHLKKLKQAGIIASRRSGLWTDYVLAGDPVTAVLVNLGHRGLNLNDALLKDDRAKARMADRRKLCCG